MFSVLNSKKTLTLHFSFGENNITTTTQRLPLEALGDKDLVDRLSKLPKDKQPFWLLNSQALDDQRKNPQTYPQRPSQFSESLNPNIFGSINPSSSNASSTNRPGLTSDSNRFSADVSVSNFDNTGINNNGFISFTNTANSNSGATKFDFRPQKTNLMKVTPASTSASGLGNKFGAANSGATRPIVQAIKPTYPVYAHIDDALGNRYGSIESSQSARLIDDSGAKASTNVDANENVKYDSRFVNPGFYYVPSPRMYW